MEQEQCEYELPSKPFQLCKRPATTRIEMNGCFCTLHATKILRSLRAAGKERYAEDIRRKWGDMRAK